MGRRWHRNKKQFSKENNRNNNKTPSSATGGDDNDDENTKQQQQQKDKRYYSNDPIRDRRILLAFLQAYFEGATKEARGDLTSMSLKIEQTQLPPSVVLPALTREVLQQPFLMLPTDLSSKQRKLVHECCVEVGLYHYSFDNPSDDQQFINDYRKGIRAIAVSIFVDGFVSLLPSSPPTSGVSIDKLPGTENKDDDDNNKPTTYDAEKKVLSLPLYKYRPWFCRQQASLALKATEKTLAGKDGGKENGGINSKTTDEKSASQTSNKIKTRRQKLSFEQKLLQQSRKHQKGFPEEAERRAAIEHLLMYPGKCLREGIDEIDFAAMKDDDLSTIPLPTLQNELDNFASGALCWTLVDTAEKMKRCIAELEKDRPTELAFDLEAYNKSKFCQLTCLLQLSTLTGKLANNDKGGSGKTYVIDPLAPGVWDEIHGLAPIFADPNVVKVGHSIGGLDVSSLHRDFGIVIVNVFDTYEAAGVLRLPARGLDAVCHYYGIQDGDKYSALKGTYQAGEWQKRPLTPPMLQYARYDVHFLLPLRRLMMRDLTDGCLDDWVKPAAPPQNIPVYDFEQHFTSDDAASVGLDPQEMEQAFEALEASIEAEENGDGKMRETGQGKDEGKASLSNTGESPGGSPGEVPGTAMTEDEETKENERVDYNDGFESDDSFLSTSMDIEDNIDPSERYLTPPGTPPTLSRSNSLSKVTEEKESDIETKKAPEHGDDIVAALKENNSDPPSNDADQSALSNEKSNNPSTNDTGNLVSSTTVAEVSTLRLQPQLAKVLTESQNRCKSLWAVKTESHLKNGSFVTLVHRARKGEVEWTKAHSKLYDDLVDWRKIVSLELECLEDFVASLNFLVLVAWKRPRNVENMRRISFFLPSVLENNEIYANQLIELVNRSFVQGETESKVAGNGTVERTLDETSDYDDSPTTKSRAIVEPSSVSKPEEPVYRYSEVKKVLQTRRSMMSCIFGFAVKAISASAGVALVSFIVSIHVRKRR